VPLEGDEASFQIDLNVDPKFYCYFSDGCNMSPLHQVVARTLRKPDFQINAEASKGISGGWQITPVLGKDLDRLKQIVVLRAGNKLVRLDEGSFPISSDLSMVYQVLVCSPGRGVEKSAPFTLREVGCD